MNRISKDATDENASKKTKLWAKVIASYESQDDDELSLEVEQQIEVTNKSQQWWWEGISKGKKGMFPSNYVILLPEGSETEQHENDTPVEAIYSSDDVEPDELTIKDGGTITDISVVQDGWWKGVVNGKKGIFSSYFVKVCPDVKVKNNYNAVGPEELTIEVGDIITDVSVNTNGWLEGVLNGKKGMFPINYVEFCKDVKVMYNYDAVQPDELTIEVGDIITDVSVNANGWLEGVLNGKRGVFPINYVEFCKDVKVKYNYDAVEPDELTIEVGDKITDVSVNVNGWWEGVLNGKRGMFPFNCVEFCKDVKVKYNYDAVEPDELTIEVGDIITDVSVTASGWWEGVLNGKRGVFPINYVKFCKDVKVKYNYHAVEPDELTIEVDDNITDVSVNANGWLEGVLNGKRGMFPIKYVEFCKDVKVKYNYDAVEPDELTIEVGDIITDVSVYSSGWWMGVLNGKRGVFPINYVEFCKGTSQRSSQNETDLAKVISSYTSHSDSELSLVEGDIITITSRPYPWLWQGIVKGKKGHFPSQCVVLVPKDEKGEEDSQQDYAKSDENVNDVIDLHKKQYIDERGGTLFLHEADVSLHVPAGALKVGCVLHVAVPLDPRVCFSLHGVIPRITPLIICEPDNLHFHLPVKLTLPHCAVIKKARKHRVEVRFGHKASQIRKEMTWSSEPVAYSLSEHYCTVFLNHFSGVDIIIGSVEEKILRVIPYTQLGQRRKHVLTVWLCNDLESDFQNVLQSEEENDGVLLDSYDTFRLRCVSGSDNKLTVRLDVVEGSVWSPEDKEAGTIDVKRLVESNKSKCNFRLISDREQLTSDNEDDESYMYFHLRVTQVVGDEKTETTFALRKRICDLKRPVKFVRSLPLNKQSSHLFSTDTKPSVQPYTAVVYMDPVRHFNDDVITTLWLWPFDSTSEIFKCLHEEQELQYRHKVDTENSFSIVDEKPNIVTRTQFLNGHWHLSPEEMKIETDRIRFGSRAKFQFIGKRHESNETEYIELQVDTFQVEEETIRFIKDVELKKLLYDKRQKVIEKFKASANEEYSESSYEDHSNKSLQSPSKLLPSTSSIAITKEPSHSKQGADGNIPPRKTEEESRTPEEQLRRCFMFLKKNLAGDWKDLGRCLKLITEDELTRLGKENKDDIEESIYQMLLRWQRKNGALASPETLIDALNEICRKDLADKLAKL